MALTGDGGDELFAGYVRYRAVRAGELVRPVAAAAVRSWPRSPIWQRLGPAGARQRSLVRRVGRFAEALRFSPQRRYLEWMSIFNEARRAELYSDEFLAQLPDADPFEFLARGLRAARGSATRSPRPAWPTWSPTCPAT